MEEKKEKRLEVISGHLKSSGIAENRHSLIENPCTGAKGQADARMDRAFPLKRHDALRWNGWGYKDSRFQATDSGVVEFTGERYSALSGETLPKLKQWFESECGSDLNLCSPSRPSLNLDDYPAPNLNDEFMTAVKNFSLYLSTDTEDRVLHGHGHTLQEIFALRHGRLARIPDAVIWPGCHEHVERIVKAAVMYDVCIIPFGGGTSVSEALMCPENETRMIVSLDMTEMTRILWIDQNNLLARIESGIIGQDLERRLAEHGFCTGHEPDSMEFSSLGGWVATRASGMKKNVYGNIEDLVVGIRAVTPIGTVEKSCQVPRISAGPDVHQFILGSEGTLGVITEVTMKIRPLPECKEYGSVVFPEFDAGVACLREIAKRRCAPASVRLMDNEQFTFGQSLKPGSTSFWTSLVDRIKAFYLLKFKQFDAKKMCVCTLLFEGSKEHAQEQQTLIYSIVPKYGGIPAGSTNGKRGYTLTFVIAYLRDLGFDHYFIAESFETSVPWDRVTDLCRNVKALLYKKCAEFNIRRKPMVTCRVTQTYDSGACVYFYFGFNYYGIPDPVKIYEEIEIAARDEIIANGGSISHHHGVGKLRKKWLSSTISEPGINMLRAVKEKVDPQNIFGVKNLL